MRAGVHAALVLVIAMFMLVPIASAATSSPTGEIHDNVDQFSDLHDPSNIGTQDTLADLQTDDTTYYDLQEANTGGAGSSEWLSTDDWDETYDLWVKTGADPYLNLQDEPTNIVYELTNGDDIGWFTFPDTTLTGTLTVNVSLYCKNDDGAANDRIDIIVDYTGGAGSDVGDAAMHTTYSYDTFVVGDLTVTQVNQLRVMLTYTKVTGPDEVYADHLRIGVSSAGGDNYEVDLELGWSAIDYEESQAQLRIYPVTGGGWPTEDIKVDIWTGTWTNVFSDLIPDQFNEVDIESYVTDATVEIRFVDGDKASDSTQDTWEIDYVEIYTYSLAYQESVDDTLNIASVATKESQKALSDTLNLASIATKEAAKLLEDTLAIASAHSTVGTFIKLLSDTLSIASVSSVVVAKLLTDTLNIASSESYKIVVQKLVEDTLAFASTNSFEIGKVLIDTLNFASVHSTIGTFIKSVEDTLAIASVSSVEVQKILTDILQFASTYAAEKNPGGDDYFKTVYDTFAIGSAVSTASDFAKSVSDTLGIASSRLCKIATGVSDELVLASVVTVVVGKVVYDTLLFDSAVSMTYDLHRTVTDVLAIGSEVDSPGFPEDEAPAGGIDPVEVAPIVKVVQQVPMFGWGILIGMVVLGFVYRVYMVREERILAVWDSLPFTVRGRGEAIMIKVRLVRARIEGWIRDFAEGY